MEARRMCLALALASFTFLGANHRTPNFVVTAPTAEFAKQVGEHAEYYRRELAIKWLGQELPDWFHPCPIIVKVDPALGAGGATSFSFDRGEVFNWNMNIQGSPERILDSVLPHEVSHTIFACHFRRPLPRWADEGAATLAENDSERHRQTLLTRQVLQNNTRIPLQKLLQITEYPKDMQDVLTLYAEGYALCDWLVQQGGRTRYLSFLAAAHQHGWPQAIKTHYGYASVEELESKWGNWVIAGCPPVRTDEQFASNGGRNGIIARGQEPTEDAPPKKVARPAAPKTPQAAARPQQRGADLQAPALRTKKKKPSAAEEIANTVSLGDEEFSEEAAPEVANPPAKLALVPTGPRTQPAVKQPAIKQPAARRAAPKPSASETSGWMATNPNRKFTKKSESSGEPDLAWIDPQEAPTKPAAPAARGYSRSQRPLDSSHLSRPTLRRPTNSNWSDLPQRTASSQSE
ncbi:MAG TPA: hypothetical protein VHB77_00295 [Planctomycetaceae bacterium]|nr:hypothetical protein [Planctomycetaceae bacterium]